MTHYLRFCFEDLNCDVLEFRLTAQGRLHLVHGGRIEIAEVKALEYVAAEGLVRDEGGEFNFKPEERDDKAMVLRALAACTGVAWHGDEPRTVERLCMIDVDDDTLEFRNAADGCLQEYLNRELVIPNVRHFTYSRSNGLVFDGRGHFCIRHSECLEKSVLLHALAVRAGVEWCGDEPVPPRWAVAARRHPTEPAEPAGPARPDKPAELAKPAGPLGARGADAKAPEAPCAGRPPLRRSPGAFTTTLQLRELRTQGGDPCGGPDAAAGAACGVQPGATRAGSTSPLEKQASARSSAAAGQGAKIAILAWGSRGDVQPVVALALRLEEFGFRVKMLVNSDDHSAFVRSFSLDAESYPHVSHFDAEALMNGEPPQDNSHIDKCPQYEAIYHKVKAFQPDLLLYCPTNKLEAWLVEERLQVCTVEFCFSREDSDDCDDLTRARECVEDSRRRRRQLESRWNSKVLPTLSVEKARALMGGRRPVLYAVSAQVASRCRSWPAPREESGVHLTGYWVLDERVQKDTAAKCSSFFGGPQAKELEEFLARHERVVYIGWGSMYVKSKQFMAQLAVRALRLAGRSGVVLGSYHGLGRDCLAGALDEAALRAYADERVLWLQWAPHEWLMPRCDVLVHHGGCGTTAASLRAGRPTVITPIAFDQFYWANLVERCGVGTATEQLARTRALDLCEAIGRCDRPGVRRMAAEMGKRLCAEDGAGVAATLLARYWRESVRTGRWKQAALGPAPAESAPKPAGGRQDLARGQPVSASSSKSPERAPENAVDGQSWTRWTSTYSDFQWLKVDLGRPAELSSVEVRWEVAFAKDYVIEGSSDGQAWAELAIESGHEGLVISRLKAGTKARWVRLNLLRRATRFGFSIWEFKVFESAASS